MFNEIRMNVFNVSFRYFVPLFVAVVCLLNSTHSNAETNDLMKGLAGLVNQLEQKDNPSNTKSAQDIKQPQAQPQNQEQQPQSIPPAASSGKTAADEAAASEAAKIEAEKSLAAIAKAEAEINAELAAGKTEAGKAKIETATAAPTATEHVTEQYGKPWYTTGWFITIFLIYVLISAIITMQLVRPPLMHWYNSQSIFISGKSIVDIFFKQIGRIQE